MDNNDYRPGDFYVICDECGFKKRSSDTRMRWDKLRVCSSTCWEPRHPQDFVRGRKDKQRVANARPEAIDHFLSDNEVTKDSL